MSTSADVLKQIAKTSSAVTSVKFASDFDNCERVPTGIFELDLALGGGIPRGKPVVVYGNESSNKTNLCLLTCKNDLRIDPLRKWVFIDVENHFDHFWAKRLGVPLEQLIVVHPDFAETAVDYVDAFLAATDIGGIIIDSLAMLTPESEATNSAGRTQVGGNSIVVGKLMRKITAGLARQAKEDHYPVVLCINQIRMKIGVMFGNPETQAGGNAPRFQSGLTLRLNGTDVVVKANDDKTPTYKKTSVIVKKAKVPYLSKECEFHLCVKDYVDEALGIGMSNDWSFLREQLKDLGWLTKEGNKWRFDGELFAKQDDVKPYIYEDPIYLDQVKTNVIKTRMVQAHGEEVWIDYESPVHSQEVEAEEA